MKRVVVIGAGSFVGEAVERWLKRWPEVFEVETVDARDDAWRQKDLHGVDVVFHVAGIAHVDPRPEMAPLYYKVNRDLAEDVARYARHCGVGQFIFMSSMIVYHASKSLKGVTIDGKTAPSPNDFYGDSKLQAEQRLKALESESFKVAVLRPCMIYGPGGKGNFQRLAGLALKTPVFPAWHNRRSMLYIDNLCEFVRQAILRDLSGVFHLQNREYADTVTIVKHFAQARGHRLFCSRLFNPLVWAGALVVKPLCKMFANQCYAPELTTYDFDYQLVSFEESLERMSNTGKGC